MMFTLSCSNSLTNGGSSTKTFYDSTNGISLSYDTLYWQDLSVTSGMDGVLLYLFTGSIHDPSEIFTVNSPSSIEIPSGFGTSEQYNTTIFTTVITDSPYNIKTYYTTNNGLTYTFTYTNKSKSDFNVGNETIKNIALF